MNLQPSELMKIGLILFLAKYYHRISTNDVNKIKHLFLPIVALTAPVLLVVAQPDLGTAILIAIGGVAVAWLAGVKLNFYVCVFIIYFSAANSNFFFETLPKIKNINFFKSR